MNARATYEKLWTVRARGKHAWPSENRSSRPQVSVKCCNMGMEPFIATQRLKHNEQIPECPKGRTPGDLTPKQLMARKLPTKNGKET